MSKSYCLTQNQLKVLLKGCGYSSVLGIGFDSTALDNAVVLRTLNELTRAGLIWTDGDAFVIEPQLDSMIKRVGGAKCCYAISSVKTELLEKCIFSGNGMLFCTVRNDESRRITLSDCSFDDFLNTLIDEGYLPEKSSEIMPEEADCIEFERSAFADCSYHTPIKENSPVLLSIERIIRSEKKEPAFLRLVRHYLSDYIVYEDDGETERIRYSAEIISKYLKKMVLNDNC